jgi:putative ATP-dependent endonuclease of the OLD family
MRIREIRIHNYRSIKDLTLECQPLVALVGPNNAGKSNILSALEFALTTAKPDAEDLFAFHDVDESELWVELEFADLTDQEANTFASYVKRSRVLRIRRTARITETGKIECACSGYVTEPAQWWLKSSAWTRLSSKELVRAEVADVPQVQPLVDKSGRLTKQDLEEFQNGYVAAHEGELEWSTTLELGALLGQPNVTGGILPDFFLVPAVRELADETKTKSTALLGRLLQRIVGDVAGREGSLKAVEEQLQSAIDQLNLRGSEAVAGGGPTLAGLEAALQSELSNWGVTVSIQVEAPSIDRIFELGTKVMIDDGHVTEAERKGHGFQRALIFALLRTWANVTRPTEASKDALTPRKTSSSAVFAVEEPELFLHPHAQRQLNGVLRSLSQMPERQVFLCTHSPAFINIEEYQGLGVVCKENPKDGTTAKQCTRDLFGTGDADEKARFHMAGWLNPDRGELFFAREVVLVEGETEERVLPVLASKLGRRVDDVTVVDCGGKNNLVAYVKLLNEFRIPYAVVHDEDPVPDPIPSDWPTDKGKHAREAFAENARIAAVIDRSFGSVHVLSPCFEDVAGVSKSQGHKVGKAMAAMVFFNNHEVPKDLADIIEATFPTA